MPKVVDKKFVGQREETSYFNVNSLHMINNVNIGNCMNMENGRTTFIRKLRDLINLWEHKLHNLQEVLSRHEIERDFLSYPLTCLDRCSEISCLRERLIELVIKSGYKNEPEVDVAGRPVLLRDTPLLRAARNGLDNCVRLLFEIYDRFDVNYTDEHGYTHFHAACRYGCDEVVKKFLELGQDPNLLVERTAADAGATYYREIRETGFRPLHLALLYNKYRTKEVMELLLRNGADPNMNTEGFKNDNDAPLHLICKMHDVELLDAFFKINDELKQEVKVDQENCEERTPLQVAILYYHADMVEYLLKNRKADPSKVHCPYHDNFWNGEDLDPHDDFYWASSGLAILDMLEKYGYGINRDVAKDLMNDLWGSSGAKKLVENWYEREDFRREAERIMVKPGLSLYRLIQLSYDEAKELLTYMEFWKFARLKELDQLPHQYRENCVAHLIKTMSQGFLERWGFSWNFDPVDCS
ncbi:hypothetical protein TKK_0005302 [Trichogramma kaykai]